MQTLPEELLLLIFSYCNPSELFHTIPSICRRCLYTLKKPTISREEITRFLLSNKSNGESEKYKKLLNNVCNMMAVEENRLWKALLLKEEPAFAIVKTDNFFCYKKHYVQNYVVEKPIYCQSNDLLHILELVDGLSTKQVRKTTALPRDEETMKKLASQVGSLASAMEFLAQQLRERQNAIECAASFSSSPVNNTIQTTKKKHRSKPVRLHHHGFVQLLTVLNETAVRKNQDTTDPDPVPVKRSRCSWNHQYEVQLLSPTNANSAKFDVRLSVIGEAENGRIIDSGSNCAYITVHLYDAAGDFVRSIPFSNNELSASTIQIEPKKLWPLAQHLGLEVYCPTMTERVTLLTAIWYDVVPPVMPLNLDIFAKTVNLVTYTGPELVEHAPTSGLDLFKVLGKMKILDHDNLNEEEVEEIWYHKLSEKERQQYTAEFSDFVAQCENLFNE